MKILMVNKFLHPNGGSETYIFKLGEKLTALGNEVQYFGMEHSERCVSNNAEQYTSNMDFHNASKLTALTYSLKTIYSTEAKRKMSIVLNDFKPDVVHINNFNFQLTPSIIYAVEDYKKKINPNVKLIFTAHDYQLICPNHMLFDMDGKPCEDCIGGKYINCTKKGCIHGSKAKSLIGSIEASLYKSLGTYKSFDAVICPSEFLKNKLDTNPALAGKTIALHNFIEKQNPTDIKKQDYVLYFGRFSKEKGIEAIIEATDINFICAGAGDYEEKINECKHIKNVGFKTGEELKALIQGAKCSVYPSVWYENCPFSVMESIMLGTPVVGANSGGIPELIDDGKTGFLFEAGNADDFKSKINKIISNDELANEMSKACLEKKFDTIDEYCDKLLKIYNS